MMGVNTASVPYPEQALTFLSAIQPGGLWHLAALGPRPTDSLNAEFAPSRADELTAWVKAAGQKGADIYLRAALAKRCTGSSGAMEDSDVTAISVLWCDVDIQAIKKLTNPADRIRVKAGVLAMLRKKWGGLAPSYINDSGNGFHLYWKLYQPLIVGDGFTHTDLSTYLYGVAKWLGGDAKCRNPSRLLRLPGTYNVKNTTLSLLCHTIEDNHVEYSIGDFDDYRDDTFLSRTPTEILEIEPTARVDINTLALPDGLLQKIVSGINPKTGLKWTDRSQLMNHIAVEMVKLNYDPAVILAVIMDGRYLHAGHVWESRDPLREARRTLNWALNAGVDDAVSRINRNFFMVCVGGHVVYGKDDLESQTPSPPREILSKGDFLTEIAPIKEYMTVKDKKGEPQQVEVNVYKKWVEDERRRRFFPHGYIIDPTRQHADGFYNLWKGFAVRAERNPWPYMKENLRCLCEGNADYYEYVMNWAALLVQQPTVIPRTAIIFHGDQGTGKTLFADALTRIFGLHAFKITKPEQLVGRFSGHLEAKIFVQVDECHFDTGGIDALKSLVSDERMTVERKGAQPFQAPNYSHILMTSNHDTVLPVDPGNRRFVIFRPLKKHKGDTAEGGFWSSLIYEMKNGGYEGMLYDLLNRDIRGWSPEASKPETASMIKHKNATASNAKMAVKLWLEGGDYSPLALSHAEDRYKPNRREVDELLSEIGIVRNHSGTIMPTAEQVQNAWEKLVGLPLNLKGGGK